MATPPRPSPPFRSCSSRTRCSRCWVATSRPRCRPPWARSPRPGCRRSPRTPASPSRTRPPRRPSFQIPGQANGFLAGQQIAQQFPQPKVALIYQNDQFGQETVSGAERAVTAAGGSIVARQPFSLIRKGHIHIGAVDARSCRRSCRLGPDVVTRHLLLRKLRGRTASIWTSTIRK